MVRFQILTVDYSDYAVDYIGVSKDAYLLKSLPANNYGGCAIISTLPAPSADEKVGVIEVKMPDQEDIIGADSLFKVELGLYCGVSGGTGGEHAIYNMNADENFDEGNGCPLAIPCNWQFRTPAVQWANFSDHAQIYSGEESAIDSAIAFLANFMWLDITSACNWGDRKRFMLRNLGVGVGPGRSFDSRESATPAEMPILRITYKSFPPEGFSGADAKLLIKPNEDDPTQSKLLWGAVDSDDFLQYKLYRDTSPITTVDGFKSAITAVVIGTDTLTIAGDHTPAFPVGSTFKITGSTGNDGRWTVASATFTGGNTEIVTVEDVTDATVDGDIHHGIWTSIDPASEEFIDTFAHVDNTTYYYKLIAEDQDNHEDDALLSAPVNFTKPDVTTAVLTPATPNPVGTLHTMTVTSPQNIKKLYVGWDDGSTSWYEFETVGTTKTATHIYSKDVGGGGFTPDVRVQDEKGFWSALQASNNMVIDDTFPTAKLVINVHKGLVGDEITLNGSYSQPAASNMTITKYEFKRDASDSWQDNGADPIYTFDSGTYPNSVGTKTASLRVTSTSALTFIDTATYDLETATPTEITPGSSGGLSNYTKIHELDHTLARVKDVAMPIGSAGVEYEDDLGRKAERFVIHATTTYPAMEDDLTIIRNAWLNNTFLRLTVKSEMETKDIQYDFMLDGDITEGHRNDNMINWSFPVRVITRTEVAKLPVMGDITAWANPGGGKVTATSNGHGLLVGQKVLITGTINYNGTYVITNVTTNTFKFVATWVANDAMGLWRKPGVS